MPILLAKFVAPLTKGFIRDDHATFTEELFHIPDAQAMLQMATRYNHRSMALAQIFLTIPYID